MSCDVSKFIISKGSDNTFVFTIKQDNSTLPLVIEAGDTFSAKLFSLSDGSEYPLTASGNELTVEDSNNGKVALLILAADTANLVVDKGPSVDRYYLRPSYKLVITATTVNNGNFIAKVPEVYVD